MAYIERAYLTEQFESRLHDDNVMCPVMKVLDALEIINTAPSADVVEVVRCKDCNFARKMVSGDYSCLVDHRLSHDENDFCSYGKRKKEG